MPSSTTLLKLTIVASNNGKPHHLKKWFRRSKTTTAAAISSSSSSSASPSSTLSRTISKACAFPPMCSRGWSLTPCAPLGLPAHGGKKIVFRRLGFGGQKINNSSSSQGGMGPLNNNSKEEQRNENDRLPSLNYDQGYLKQPSRPTTTKLRQQQQQQSAKLLTLPTILTIGRVAAIPVLVSTFYMNSWLGTTATTSIFIAAAITDWLDGYLARRMNLGTAFGAFLDPVADKLMVAATLVLLCTRPPEVAMFEQLPWLLTVPSIAIIGREITMSAVREWAASQGSKLSEAVAVNNLGKWKTATQMISLTILLATRDSSFTETGVLVGSGVALLYVSAGLAVWSLVVYMRKIWKFLMI